MAEEVLSINGGGSYQAWEQSNGMISEYENINQTSTAIGSLTNHIYEQINGQTSTYNFENTAASSGATINSVTLNYTIEDPLSISFPLLTSYCNSPCSN